MTTSPGTLPAEHPKNSRLKKRSEFVRVASGQKWSTKTALLQARAPAAEPSKKIRVGFTATKRLGNAVIRNRAKRRLRAAAAEIFPQFGRPGLDYVLIARPGALTQPFKLVLDDIKEALKRVHAKTDSREEGHKRPSKRSRPKSDTGTKKKDR